MEEQKTLRIPETDVTHGVPLVLTPRWLEADEVAVSVQVSHSSSTLHLRFLVREPQLRRMCTRTNDAVYTDSCVEVFLQKDGEASYRNFEFSAAGYALVGNGEGREDRRLYGESLIESIPLSVSILENTLEKSIWSLDVSLDLKAFDLDDRHLHGNFYKCGDGLRKPHYLSYAPIGSVRPDFHRPGDFVPLELL